MRWTSDILFLWCMMKLDVDIILDCYDDVDASHNAAVVNDVSHNTAVMTLIFVKSSYLWNLVICSCEWQQNS